MNTLLQQSTQISTRRKNKFVDQLKKNHLIYLMMTPGIIYFLIFSYVPMIGIVVAFQDYSPLKGLSSDFVGFKNFEFFFTSLDWIRVTFNTLYLNALFIVTITVLAIMIAIVITELKSGLFVKFNQSIVILPHFISWPIVALFMYALLASDGGFINTLLVQMGFHPISFYTNVNIWPLLLVIMKLWKEAGFASILYIATIANIDTEIYEAAKIDGAKRLQSIFYITIPLLKTTVILLALLALGRIFYGDFGMIYALVGDNALLYKSTDVIDTFVFRALRMNGEFGMSAAVGLYQSVVGFILLYTVNTLTRKFDKDSALF